MNMAKLLLLSKCSKYAFTILIYLMKKPSIYDTTRNTYSDSHLTVGKNVLLKPILCTYEKYYNVVVTEPIDHEFYVI